MVSKRDLYFNEEGVLINKLGITDNKLLQYEEAGWSLIRAVELKIEPIEGEFDFEHYKDIHKHLFGDVYEWAGKTRLVEISKGNTQFCMKNQLDSFAESIFKAIQKDIQLMKFDSVAISQTLPEILAGHFGELNALHPFRDGNGRTQKAFISQMASAVGVKINWGEMSKDELIEASIESFNYEPKLLTKLIKGSCELI